MLSPFYLLETICFNLFQWTRVDVLIYDAVSI